MSIMSVLWSNPDFLAMVQKMQAEAAPVVPGASMATARANSSAPASDPKVEAIQKGLKPGASMATAPANCSVPASDPKVEAIQKGLKKAGFDPGKIDGIMGINTRAAIKQLQHNHHLPTTGVMDAKTQTAFGAALVTTTFIDVAASFAGDMAQGMNEMAVTADKQKAADIAKHIADLKQRITNSRSDIQALEHAVAKSNELRESTSSLVTGPVHAYGGSWEPIEISDFKKTNNFLTSAQKALADGNLSGAEELLRSSDGEFSLLNDRFAKYGEGIQKGGERVVSGLKVVKVASAATVGIVAAVPVAAGGIGLGMVGVAAVGGINAGAQNLAQQESEVRHGLRDKINFKDIAVESVVGAVTSYFGGKLGNMVVEKLMGTAAASLGRKAVATLVGDYLSGSVGGTANLTIQTLYAKARGSGSDLTWGEFLVQLVDQFTDRSQVLTNIVMGHVSRAAGASLGGAEKVRVGGRAEPSTGSHEGKVDVETHGNAPESPSQPPPPKKAPSRAEVEDAQYKAQRKAFGNGPLMKPHPGDGKSYTVDEALSQKFGLIDGFDTTLMKVIWRDNLGKKGNPPEAFGHGGRIAVNTTNLRGEQLQKYIAIDKARNPDGYTSGPGDTIPGHPVHPGYPEVRPPGDARPAAGDTLPGQGAHDTQRDMGTRHTLPGSPPPPPAKPPGAPA